VEIYGIVWLSFAKTSAALLRSRSRPSQSWSLIDSDCWQAGQSGIYAPARSSAAREVLGGVSDLGGCEEFAPPVREAGQVTSGRAPFVAVV
jgi:hypothetical protein